MPKKNKSGILSAFHKGNLFISSICLHLFLATYAVVIFFSPIVITLLIGSPKMVAVDCSPRKIHHHFFIFPILASSLIRDVSSFSVKVSMNSNRGLSVGPTEIFNSETLDSIGILPSSTCPHYSYNIFAYIFITSL